MIPDILNGLADWVGIRSCIGICPIESKIGLVQFADVITLSLQVIPLFVHILLRLVDLPRCQIRIHILPYCLMAALKSKAGVDAVVEGGLIVVGK